MAHTSVKISANSSDYQSQMKSAASQMKVLSSEFKLAQTQAKAFGSAADQLKAKAESLTQKITLQKNIVQLNSEQQAKLTQKLSDQKTKQEELKTKVEAAKKAYEDSTKATGANSEQSKALKEELDKLEQEFKANETAIGKTETALANQTTKTNASKASLVEMESELEKVNKELKNHKLNEFASGCDKAGQKMESFGKKMSVVSAGIAAIGAASIAAFKELDEGYDTIVTKTGATGEALEGLTASADNVFGSMPEDIKSSFSTKLNGALSTVGSVMESIRAKFSEKMESAKTAVSNAIDRIKGFFNFEWSLPHLKMPHFSISGSFSLNPPSVPSFGVEWYKTGGIMTSPTVFGMNGTRLMVGGEAGAEAILPLAEFYTELNSMLDRKLKAINQNVNAFIEVHNYIDGDEVASRTTEKVSDNLAIATKKRR